MLFPQPTYIIGTHAEDGTLDLMMMAWGGMCAEDMIALNISERHKTTANIRAKKTFTLSVARTRYASRIGLLWHCQRQHDAG